MPTNKNAPVSIVVVLLTAIFSSAVMIWAESPGATAFNFLKIGMGPRAVGMGESFTAIADDASAVYWNPAGLPNLNRYEISLSHYRWFEDITFQDMSIAVPGRRRGALGIAVFNLNKDNIQGYDVGGSATGKVGFSDTAVSLSFAYPLPWFATSAGITAKYIQENIAGEKTSSFAFDVGLLGKFPIQGLNPLQAGIMLKNIGPRVKYTEESSALPLMLSCGMSWLILHDALLVSADYTIPNDDDGFIATGIEFKALPFAAFRAGYRTRLTSGDDVNDGVRCGIGIGNKDISLDYAYAPFGVLGDTHRFGISARFGMHYHADQYQCWLDRHLYRANLYYRAQDLSAANEQITMVLTLDPGHSEALNLQKKIAAEIDSTNIQRYIVRAKTLINDNNLSEAKAVCERIGKLKSDIPELNALIREIDQRLAQERDRRMKIFLQQGEEFFAKEAFSDAIGIWEKILLIDFNNEEARARIEKAREKQIEQQMEKKRLYINLLLNEAETAYSKKHFERAAEILEQILKENPKQEKALEILNITKQELDLKQQSRSEELLEKGKICLEKNDIEKAHRLFKEALEAYPENKKANAYYQDTKKQIDDLNLKRAQEANKKGLAAYGQGELKEAIRYFEEALKYYPAYEEAQNNLLRARKELNR